MVESKHYFATLVAIVCIVAISVFQKKPAPTEPEVINDQYYYDVETFSNRHKPVMIEFDSLPFKHAFSVQRAAKGPNAEFYWNGNFYTTSLAEEEDMSEQYLKTRYLVEFVINDEQVSKFFDNELQAYTFAEMVEGSVVKFSETRYN